MAQEVTTLNNPKYCSVIQVDKDISFVLDNRDIDFALSVPTEKHIGMSRRTYSRKQPFTYHPGTTLLENKLNGDCNNTPQNKKSHLKDSPKCTSSTSEKTISRKRPLGIPKSSVPKKIGKKEPLNTNAKVPLARINGRITGKLQKSSQIIDVPSEPDIEIIEVIERGTSKAFKRDCNDYFSGRERNKKNSKSLPNNLKLYPSNYDIPITEADIAPVIPSNSVIPDTSISETNQDINPPNKWILPTGVSSIKIVDVRGAKESDTKYDECDLQESGPSVPQSKAKLRGRELKNLFENLNEISWTKEDSFRQMINISSLQLSDNRHSERITAKISSGGKNLRRLKADSGNKPLLKNKKRKTLAKKNSANLALNKAKYGRLKPKLVLKKDLKYKTSTNKVNKTVSKPILKSNRKLNAKTTQPKVVKQKAAIAEKCHFTGKSSAAKAKVGNCSRNIVKNVLPSALKKTVKTEQKAQVMPENDVSDSKDVKKIEYSKEVNILEKSYSDNKVYSTAVKKGSKLRVHVEPLEHTNLWNTGFCEAFSKYVIEQSSSQMETKNKESIKAMFDELMESWYCNSADSAKLPRKKKPEEETLRSSVRQSEGAFRYKEIVVKKHENYMQFILVPNTIKQNSLSIEAMKELRDAFLLAKKDPNCRAVLINSSGTFFCTGIDLSLLIGNNKKQAAEEMASTIKELVLTLSTFTKPVIAAVNGTAVGFGVTLLTLCDVVLASDKATFCIPATRLGYLPEGAITLTLPQVVGSTVATELLLYGRRLTADQALRHGLVSEVLWHSNLMNEVIPRVQIIVSQPLQVMEATKTMVRCQLWDRLKFHMEREWRLLPPLWLDAQCQNNIKKALQTGWLID